MTQLLQVRIKNAMLNPWYVLGHRQFGPFRGSVDLNGILFYNRNSGHTNENNLIIKLQQ